MADLKDEILDVALKRCFLIQACEIYGSMSGVYDYGHVGCALKRKIEDAWRRELIVKEGNYEVATSLILPEIVLKASGHVGHFSDPLVDCKKCKKRFRADHLVGGLLKISTEELKPEQLAEVIRKEKVRCPDCGGELEEVKPFNLMFKTNIGPVEGNVGYTRPETAQGIFLDFQREFRATGSKLPMGIAQIGRSFRNEISPRQGLIRLREFTQMELEYFFDPKKPTHARYGEVKKTKMRFYTREEQKKESKKIIEMSVEEAVKKKTIPNELLAYFLVREQEFYLKMGVPYEKFHFRHLLEGETPHYSGGNLDLEVDTLFGWVETIGTAYRTDYDLGAHAKMSGKDQSVFMEETKERFVPHVVEPSFGVERLLWCVLESAYRKEGGAENRNWSWFDFPCAIAPYDAAIFPLMKKDGMQEKAREIVEMLREANLEVNYDESGSVGKRYARADEIGTPYCITVDYDTAKDESVTVRFRNDGKQVRVKVSELAGKLKEFKKKNKVTG
ncbi:MAG: glycine--tRNA ligase [Candidatus Micrarchaeota archaeon]